MGNIPYKYASKKYNVIVHTKTGIKSKIYCADNQDELIKKAKDKNETVIMIITEESIY